jgi:SAM-dependent methyltransferase
MKPVSESLPPPSDFDAEATHSGLRPSGVESGVADYAAFDGGRGRDIYFRPDRYQRSDFGPVGAAVELRQGDHHHYCELQDVSQNGIAFEWPRELVVEIGTILDEVVVRFDNHEAYRGQARVSSVRRDDKRTLVGASLTDTLMNIEDVLNLRDVKAWTAGSDAQGLGLRHAPWRVPGQEQFKAQIAELRLAFEDAQARMGELEASLPWHVVSGDQDSPARDALIERIRAEFSEDVIEASNAIDSSLRSAGRNAREALREYSLRHVHSYLMQVPWMHRARHKPLGYPGDFEVMNGVYSRQFSGSTLFAKALNLAFSSTPAAEAVRTRKNLLKRRLGELLDSTEPGTKPIRILSIAAGPAQEIFELLQEREEIPVPLEIVLFDQDKRALSYSYGRLKRVVSSRWPGLVTLVHLHDSIKRLLRDSGIFAGQGAFDVVIACGLFDYLQLLTAVSLSRNLYSILAPGGTLYIGNMVPSNPSRWFMELHLDWYLVYRERSELLELSRMAAPDARIQLLEEPTGVNPFVAFRRE